MCTCSPVEAVNVPPHDAVAASVLAFVADSAASGIAVAARASSAAAGVVNRLGAAAAVAEPADTPTGTIAATTTNGMTKYSGGCGLTAKLCPRTLSRR
jgi:hypothetical protein